jgi:hypothetical protein
MSNLNREEFSPHPRKSTNPRRSQKSTVGRKASSGNLSSVEHDREQQQLLHQQDHHKQDMEDRKVERQSNQVDIILRLVREFGSTLCIASVLCIIFWAATQRPKEADNIIRLAGLAVAVMSGRRYLDNRRETAEKKTKALEPTTYAQRKSVESAKSQKYREPEISVERRNPLLGNEIAQPQKTSERREPSLPETPKRSVNRMVEIEEEVSSEELADFDCVEYEGTLDDETSLD